MGGDGAIVIAGIILLIAWLRPVEKRRGLRIAAFVLVALALPLGPVWGTESFFWVTNVG